MRVESVSAASAAGAKTEQKRECREEFCGTRECPVKKRRLSFLPKIRKKHYIQNHGEPSIASFPFSFSAAAIAGITPEPLNSRTVYLPGGAKSTGLSDNPLYTQVPDTTFAFNVGTGHSKLFVTWRTTPYEAWANDITTNGGHSEIPFVRFKPRFRELHDGLRRRLGYGRGYTGKSGFFARRPR